MHANIILPSTSRIYRWSLSFGLYKQNVSWKFLKVYDAWKLITKVTTDSQRTSWLQSTCSFIPSFLKIDFSNIIPSYTLTNIFVRIFHRPFEWCMSRPTSPFWLCHINVAATLHAGYELRQIYWTFAWRCDLLTERHNNKGIFAYFESDIGKLTTARNLIY